MIAHVPAVASKAWTGPAGAHLLELSGAQAEIEGRLLGRKEGTSLLGSCGTGDLVVHLSLILGGADGIARFDFRVQRPGRRSEARI
jgi:hypothetical protein